MRASVGVGAYRDVQSAVEEMQQVCDEMYSSDAAHAKYDRIYKIYLKLYYALKDVFPYIASYQEQ